jgi:uncharacterized protein YjbI with pentapeptide repeats/uncharacterized membrane protein YhdT
MPKKVSRFLQQHQTKLLITLAIVLAVVLGWILFATVMARNTGFEGKTLWDWMELLIVPLVIAIGLWWLNRSEKQAEMSRIRYRQQQDDLQTYINNMTKLLLEHKLTPDPQDKLLKPSPERAIARTLTLNLLSNLAPHQKSRVLLFLYESRLIERVPLVNLAQTDLLGIDLAGMQLREINLSGADMREANLARTQLPQALLIGTDLQEAILTGAKLPDATLWQADLRGTDLHGTVLEEANLREAKLNGANLREANLRGCKLQGADLRGTEFDNAVLSEANLQGAIVDGEPWLRAKERDGLILPDGTQLAPRAIPENTSASVRDSE